MISLTFLRDLERLCLATTNAWGNLLLFLLKGSAIFVAIKGGIHVRYDSTP
jgi:hypothetical protein